MNDLTLVLQVIALVCWIIATLGLFPSPRWNWWYAGWTFILASLMLSGLDVHVHQIAH